MNYFREIRYCIGLLSSKNLEGVRCLCFERDAMVNFCKRHGLLRPGLYVMVDGEKDILCHRDCLSELGKTRLWVQQNFLKTIFFRLASVQLVHALGNDDIVGDCIFRTYDGHYKVIDFQKKRVFFFADTQYVDLIWENAKQLSQFMNVSIIGKGNNVLIEKYIDERDSDAIDYLKKYCGILDTLRCYYSNVAEYGKSRYVDEITSLKNSGNQNATLFLSRCSSLDIYEEDLPIVLCHGDLHEENIMFDGGEKWYIDFADARVENIFFDLFKFFFHKKSRFSLLKERIVCDLLRDIFSIFCLHFDSKKIQSYLARFVVANAVLCLQLGENSLNFPNECLDDMNNWFGLNV